MFILTHELASVSGKLLIRIRKRWARVLAVACSLGIIRITLKKMFSHIGDH